jgi:hypothetical protein
MPNPLPPPPADSNSNQILNNNDAGDDSIGGIIGGAAGAVVVLLLAAGGLYAYLKKKKMKKAPSSGPTAADVGGVTLTIGAVRGEATLPASSTSDIANKKPAQPTPIPGVPTQPATKHDAAAQSTRPAPEIGRTGTPLNEPGRWKYFVSHVQRECKLEAVMLANEWGKEQCWLDRFMEDKSVAAMEEGVKGSEIFVCILSDGYFDSEYCCNEMRWAFETKKPIISTYRIGVNVGALLNKAPEEFRAQIKAIDSMKLDADDSDYFEVSMKKITKRLVAAGINST